MAEDINNITNIVASFNTIVEDLKKYKADDNGELKQNAKALNDSLKALEVLGDTHNSSEIVKIKTLFNKNDGIFSAFSSSNSNLSFNLDNNDKTKLGELSGTLDGLKTDLSKVNSSLKKIKDLKIGELEATTDASQITSKIKQPITNIETALTGLNSSLKTLSDNIKNEKDDGPYKNIISIATELTGGGDASNSGFVGKIDTVKQALSSVNSSLKKILTLKLDQSVENIVSSSSGSGETTNTQSNSIQKIIGALNKLNTDIGTTKKTDNNNTNNTNTTSLSGAVTSFKGTLSALLGENNEEGVFGKEIQGEGEGATTSYQFISDLTSFKDILKNTNTALKGIIGLRLDPVVEKIIQPDTESNPLKTTIIKDAIKAINDSLGKNDDKESFYNNVKNAKDTLNTYFNEKIFGDLDTTANKYSFAIHLDNLKAVFNQSNAALKGIGGINIDDTKLGKVDSNVRTIRRALRAIDINLGTGKEGSNGVTLYSIISGLKAKMKNLIGDGDKYGGVTGRKIGEKTTTFSLTSSIEGIKNFLNQSNSSLKKIANLTPDDNLGSDIEIKTNNIIKGFISIMKTFDNAGGKDAKKTMYQTLLDFKTSSINLIGRDLNAKPDKPGGITGHYMDGTKNVYELAKRVEVIKDFLKSLSSAMKKVSELQYDNYSKNMSGVISSLKGSLITFSTEMSGFNEISEIKSLSELVTFLKLGEKSNNGTFEHSKTKQIITEEKFNSLTEEQQSNYTFVPNENNDLSITASITALTSFITSIVKSIEKVSSVSMKTVVLAPVKMKMISNTIQKSITSMITAVDSINKTAADYNIHQLLGWEEGNNQYLINADGSYKMEKYTEGDKTEMRKIENARYTKGHFKAETGLFKLGDYVATLIGIVEKIGNINPLTIKKSSVKIKMCIGLIAKSVADIANALATEMKGVSEKMTSEDMEIMLGVTRKDVYQIGTKGEANQIGEVKQEGLFTGLLTFFSIYDNMMKIAAEGGIKVIMQTEIAKMRILRIIEAMASISEALMTSKIGDSKETINAINSLKDSINSLKSIASGLADSKLASNTTIAERTIKSMRDIFDMLIGKGNDDKEQPILLKLSQLTSKYEEMNKDSKGPSSLKSLSDDMKSISGIVASFALMSLMAPIAITGVLGTKMFLSIFLGRDPKTGKEDGKTTGGGIIGMIVKLRQRWDEAENVSGGSVRTTLLITSGSLILFMGAFVIIGKLAGAAIKGVALTGAMIVLILAIFKVVQFIAKMGKNRDTGDGSILSKLFTAKEQKSQIPSVKTMLMIAGGFIMFVMSLSLISLFGKYAIKGMLVVAGLLIMTMGILWIVNKIATMGKTLKQRMFDVGTMKMGSDIPAIRMLLGISAGIILFTVSLSLVALFAPYAFKGLLAFTGLVLSALLLLTLVMKIASIGSNIADKFNIKGLLGGDNNIPAIKMLLMISAGFLMFTMSLILIQLVKSVAWEGLLAVTLMVTMTLGVLMVLSSMDKNIGDARKALIGVAIAMLGFTLSLIVISVLIKAVGFGVVMGSLLTLLIGVGICVAALYLINKIGVADVTKGAISLLIMSAAFIVFGIALKIISNALNVLSWENIGKLVLVVGMFIGVTILAGLSIVYISIGSVAMGLMSGALLLFAVMLDKLANAMKDVSIDTFATLPSIMGMLLLVLSTAALGILTVPIGSMVVTMMSGSLLLFGEMLDKMKKSIKGVSTDMFKDLPSIMGSLQVVFLKAALGILTVPIGAGVIMMMHKPLLALSELLPKMKDAVRGMKGTDFEQLSDIMVELRVVFKQASLGFLAITIGTPAILMLSGTMTVFSEALSKIKPNITGLSVDEFNSLPTIMDSLVDTFSTAALGILTVPIGAGVIMMMTAPLLMMSKAFVNIREAFKGMNVKKDDNPFENMIGGMIKGIGTFITEVRNIDIKFKDIMKLNRLRLLSRNISEIALLLSDIANMQIACAWDKEGNPTKYRQMTTNDFRMAKDNVSLILAAMIDISKSISEEGAGKELKNMNRREIKRQARRMNAVMRIVEPISTMVDFIKSLAEGKLTIYDDKTQKDKTISFNEYFGNEAIRGNIKTNIGNLILFINDIAKDIGAEDSKYKMEKGDRKAAEKQADRMTAAMGIIDPLMSLVDFIKLLSEGTIEHVDDNGKKTKISISKLIHDETLRTKIKDSTLGLMEMMNVIAHDINESNLEVEEIDADNLMTNAETINSVMASISNIANAKSTNSYVKVADSTSKLVHAINELDATKGSVFKDILYDLEKMNYSLGDVFDRIENAIVRLSTELGKMNGVELKSVTSKKPSSSSSSVPMQNTMSPNLTNIESDVDDLLNELRSIKALMQR